MICGITEDTQQYHIIRAALEAVCFQTRDILEAMVKDAGTTLTELQVDGGMTANNLLMQLQADLTGVTVGTEYDIRLPKLGSGCCSLIESMNAFSVIFVV